MQQFISWDIRIFNIINKTWHCNFLNKIMPVITHLGGAFSGFFFGLLFFIIPITEKRWQPALVLFTSQVIVQIIKKAAARIRPYLTVQGANIWAKLILKDYSLPSGHTTTVFSFAVCIGLFHHWTLWITLPVAILTGISRIYLGLHYPTDVALGALIGTVCSFVIYWLV